MPNFRIRNKIIFGTFGSDYNNQLTCEFIINYFNNKFNSKEKKWEFYVIKSHGDEKISHDHFHFLATNIEEKKFSTRNQRFFDIELPKPVYANYLYEKSDHLLGYSFDEKLITNAVRNKFIINAHPFIEPVNLKKKNSLVEVYEYMLKQKIDESSNYNYLNNYIILKEKNNNLSVKNKKKSETQQLKEELSDFIKQHWQLGTSKEVLIEKIIQNPKFKTLYMFNQSIQSFVNTQFNKSKLATPIPIFGKYWVTRELKEYLEYLDNYVRTYYEEVINPCKNGEFENYEDAMEKFCQNHKERGKTIIIKGTGGIGKTHLLACFGPCSYWKDRFNFDQWNNYGAFNWFDDLDIYGKSADYVNNTIITATDWEYLKTWIGGQYHSTFSGKYRSVKTVINYKPCVFITNNNINERFSESALKYMKEIEVTFVNLNYKLYKKPNMSTIGGFCKYVEIDTRNTYYYKNIYSKKNEVESPTIEIIDENLTDLDEENLTPTEIIDFSSEDEFPIASSNIGRPKRKNFFQNFLDNLTENRRKKSRTL